MKKLIVTALFCALLHSCSGRCRVSSQCDRSERCDFVEGVCVQGCTTKADCFPGECNTVSGFCIPAPVPPFDLPVSTSTISDAGDPADAGS